MAQLPGIPYNSDGSGNPSTGAPGGGDISATQPGPGSTGVPNNAGTAQAQPQDLESVSPANTHDGSPAHHSYVENTYNVVDQSGYPHDGVEAAQGHGLAGIPGITDQFNDPHINQHPTDAGRLSHDHYGRN